MSLFRRIPSAQVLFRGGLLTPVGQWMHWLLGQVSAFDKNCTFHYLQTDVILFYTHYRSHVANFAAPPK